jgi:hypothetical protein
VRGLQRRILFQDLLRESGGVAGETMSNDKAAILFAAHDGTIAVWPNPEGPLAHLFEEVDVEVNERWLRRPRVWVFRFAIMIGPKFEKVHGLLADWRVLKDLMELEGIRWQEIPGEHVPCARNYDWFPPKTGETHGGQQGWYGSDATQLRSDFPLAIFHKRP